MRKKIVLVLVYTLLQFGVSLLVYWALHDKITWEIIKGFSIYIVSMIFMGILLMKVHIYYFSNKLK